jgi:radical SAM-linked protein
MGLIVPSRVRIRFCKHSDLRLISHRDLARAFERLFRRSGIALRMSEGFHPKPRMSFPAPLGLGIVGLDEVLEVELAAEIQSEELLAALSAQAPAGLSFKSAEVLAPQARKGQVGSQRFELRLPEHRVSDVTGEVARLLAAQSRVVHREDLARAVDLRPLILELEVVAGVLRIRLRVNHEAGARPRDVLSTLGLTAEETTGLLLSRTAVELLP